jgi:ubiquinone/menaquinone biosynthesis C-methylase UbiE
MGGVAAYDRIADWYEEEFLGAQSGGDPLGISRALRVLLGVGSGPCLEIGCGTGVYAGQVRELGWTPMGVDLSAGMLRHAKGRMPIARPMSRSCAFVTAACPRPSLSWCTPTYPPTQRCSVRWRGS